MFLTNLRSFRQRLLIGVVAPIFLIQSLGLVLELWHLESDFKETLSEEAKIITHMVGESLVLPLWDFDMPKVENLIQGLMANGSVGRVTLTDVGGATLAEQTAEWFVPDAQSLQAIHSLTYDIGGQQEALGTLAVSLSTDKVTAALMQSLYHKVVFSVVILGVITIIVFGILSHIALPLTQFPRVIGRIGDGFYRDIVPGEGRQDEIGQVAKAISQWREKEIEISDLRAQNNETARRERKRISRALKATQDAVLIADENRNVVFGNEQAFEFFSEASVGHLLSFHRCVPSIQSKLIDDALIGQTEFDFERPVSVRSGAIHRELFMRGSPIRDEDNRFLGTVVLATDHTDQVRQIERAKYMAEHDSLTGLPNRRLMEATLEQWLNEPDQEATILLADLDAFKQINDTLGYQVGDTLLQHVAFTFANCLGRDAIAARLSGDDFAIIVKGPQSADRAAEMAKDLLATWALPQLVAGRLLHSSLSIGIATIEQGNCSADGGVRRADLALDEAKKSGRGGVEVFRTDLEEISNRKSMLHRELRRALEGKEIFPVFQMQTDLKSGEIIGFEALARWQHPDLGAVSPAEFIPIAEESGLIADLTNLIMMQSCAAALVWRDHGFTGRIAVNLSPKLFGAGVVEFVSDCLMAANCPAAAIEVEITESVVLANRHSARQEIEALQALGLTIALDDFGMGYSSLSYLQQFPVDKIKIDRAFVSKMLEADEPHAIVVAITNLGHALGMSVTAEGAETDEERLSLRACDVDYLQGFVNGQPLPMDEITEVLQSRLIARKAS